MDSLITSSWHPESWKSYSQFQQPEYDDHSNLKKVLYNLKISEKLISENEIGLIQHYISEAQKGKAFILQAGDCAETFESCTYDNVSARVSHLKELADLLQSSMNIPVIIIGRIAGQYAKPRSKEYEVKNNLQIPSYRGDIINSLKFNLKDRKPDPARLQTAFENSKSTLLWIQKTIEKEKISYLNSKFFISHEALLLNYESNLTHKSIYSNKWFNFSTHFLWLGERTRSINSAHVEYLRGISNPIGIKIGPTTNLNELIEIIKLLNPKNECGKINLISRIGKKDLLNILPKFILKIHETKLSVAWSCDPMHGNSYKTTQGIKTRHFQDIWKELNDTFHLHKELGSLLSGIHLEVSNQNVTECLGGESNITEDILNTNYQSYCDPRLNRDQSIELINLLIKQIKR